MPSAPNAPSVVVTIRMPPALVKRLLKVAGPHGTLSKVVRALLMKALGKS